MFTGTNVSQVSTLFESLKDFNIYNAWPEDVNNSLRGQIVKVDIQLSWTHS